MIKAALVGCGRISKRHISVLLGGELVGAELAALCDIMPIKARETGDRYKVPWFSDMETMVKEAKPDLVSILTPSGDHVAHICQLAPYGIPLLVEKPLALTLEGMDTAMETCERYGTKLGEVKQNRYNVAVQCLRDAMFELQRPFVASVRVWWHRDWTYYADWHGHWDMAGGVLANQAIHHIDLMRWLLGDVRQVSAFATYMPYAKVETSLVATLEFESGCIGTIEATTLTQPRDLEGSLAILGYGGTVELGGFAVNEIRRWEFEPELPKPEVSENPPDVYGFGHLKLYEDVIDCLEEGHNFPISAHDARACIEIAHAIYESAETGRIVELDGHYPNSRLGR